MSVRVGVVGCGWWATAAHLPGIRDHPEAELTAVADRSDANRERAAREFGAGAAYADAEDMLDAETLDAVVVATPPAHHFAPAAAALQRGINVLVEKPMVLGSDEAHKLVGMAEEAGCRLSVGYTWHFSPHVSVIREQIAAGRIGDVEYVSSTFASVARALYEGSPEQLRDFLGSPSVTPDAATYADPAVAGGGQVQAQLTHSLALILHLTGLRVESLAAFLAGFELEVDLADAVAVAFEGGAVGSIGSAGSVVPGQWETLDCRVLGRTGHVELNVTAGTASLHGPGPEVEHLPPLQAGDHGPGEVDNLDLYPEQAPVENLIDQTLGRAENVNPGSLGAHVVEVIEAIYRAAGDHAVVEVRGAAGTDPADSLGRSTA